MLDYRAVVLQIAFPPSVWSYLEVISSKRNYKILKSNVELRYFSLYFEKMQLDDSRFSPKSYFLPSRSEVGSTARRPTRPRLSWRTRRPELPTATSMSASWWRASRCWRRSWRPGVANIRASSANWKRVGGSCQSCGNAIHRSTQKFFVESGDIWRRFRGSLLLSAKLKRRSWPGWRRRRRWDTCWSFCKSLLSTSKLKCLSSLDFSSRTHSTSSVLITWSPSEKGGVNRDMHGPFANFAQLVQEFMISRKKSLCARPATCSVNEKR